MFAEQEFQKNLIIFMRSKQALHLIGAFVKLVINETKVTKHFSPRNSKIKRPNRHI